MNHLPYVLARDRVGGRLLASLGSVVGAARTFVRTDDRKLDACMTRPSRKQSGPSGSRTDGGRDPHPGAKRRRAKATRRPHPRRIIFRFVLWLLLILGSFEVGLATDTMKESVIPQYLRFCATVSGGTMRLFGEKVTVHDSTISSPRYSVNVKRGCDAVQPTALFVAAVFASPVVFWPKVPGVVGGVLFLMVMNLVRVISLFYTGVYYPRAFDVMHHDVWQAAFIFISISLWALWAVWAARLTAVKRHATR